MITKAQSVGLINAAEAYERVYQEGVRLGKANPGEQAVLAAVVALGFKFEEATPLLPPEPEEAHD